MGLKPDGRAPTLEERRDDALEQARLSGVAAEQAEAAKADITAAEAAGEIDAEEAARRFAEADETVQRQRRDGERLQRLAAKIAEDIDRYQYAERHDQYQAARAAAEEACTEANKAAAILAQRLASAVKSAASLAAKRDARQAAIDAARAACPSDVDFEYPAGFDGANVVEPDWLPDRAGLKALLDLIADERKHASRESATRAAAEQGKRERARTARKELMKRYAWTGDEDLLAEIRSLDLPAASIDEAVAEAVKAHAAVRARAQPVVEKILANAQRGRTSPRGALDRLSKSPDIPDDLRAEAARELEAAAGVAA